MFSTQQQFLHNVAIQRLILPLFQKQGIRFSYMRSHISREPIDRSGPNFTAIQFRQDTEYLRSLGQVGLSVPEIQDYAYMKIVSRIFETEEVLIFVLPHCVAVWKTYFVQRDIVCIQETRSGKSPPPGSLFWDGGSIIYWVNFICAVSILV